VELLVSGCSIKEVAYKVGYCQSSAFVEMFRRTFGTTPKVWISALNNRSSLQRNPSLEPRISMSAKSPMHSFSRDRQAEIGFRQGSSSAEISNSAFMISLRSL
jgi:AraC-like DNA-binding protein